MAPFELMVRKAKSLRLAKGVGSLVWKFHMNSSLSPASTLRLRARHAPWTGGPPPSAASVPGGMLRVDSSVEIAAGKPVPGYIETLPDPFSTKPWNAPEGGIV